MSGEHALAVCLIDSKVWRIVFKPVLCSFPPQAFLHRIRQTPDDQQCLSPEHVKVWPVFYCKYQNVRNRPCENANWSLMSLLFPHLCAPLWSSLCSFPSLLRYIPSLYIILSFYRFCFQILRTSLSCTRGCCLQWNTACCLNLSLTMHWDMCSSSL